MDVKEYQHIQEDEWSWWLPRRRIAMKRILLLILQHRGALLLAFVAGALCIAPTLYFASVAPGYNGIAMMGSDAEGHYAARVAEIYDGHLGLGNVFILPKNQPYFAPSLGERILTGIGASARLSPSGIVVFSKFLFPFLIVLLVYALAYSLIASRIGAGLAAVLVVLGDAVLGGPSSLLGVISGHAPVTSFLLYARPINPEMSAVFLFSALLILAHFFFKKKEPTWFPSVALGLLGGGALYISPYISSFIFTFLGLSVLWFFFHKNYAHSKALIASIAFGLMAIVPFFLNFIELHKNPLFTESSIHQGLIHTHAPNIGFWIIVLIVCLFIWPRRYLTSRPFFIIGVVALVILLNQQVVTGLALQSAHYHWYLTKPLAGMVLALFAVFLVEWLFTSKILRGIAYSICFSVLLISAVMIQWTSYKEHYAETLDAQAYAPVLSFLRTLPVGQSVWADRNLSLYIPIYTQQDAPNNGYAGNYLVSQTFLEGRLLLEYTLREVPPAGAFSTMQTEREDIAQRLFDVYWRDQHGSYAAIPDSLLEKYAIDYKKTAHQSIGVKLEALGASIVVWDTQTDPLWNIGRILGTNPIFRNGRFGVYQLATTTSSANPYK